VELQTTSAVHGDIATRRLLVQEGGEINGVLRMGEGAPEPAAVATVR
jgi:cytoskeletal protein CcmA (bactofilin family)